MNANARKWKNQNAAPFRVHSRAFADQSEPARVAMPRLMAAEWARSMKCYPTGSLLLPRFTPLPNTPSDIQVPREATGIQP